MVGQVLQRDRAVGHLGILLEDLETSSLLDQREEVAGPVPPQRPGERLAARLRRRVGDEHVARDAPRRAIGDAPALPGPRLDRAPVRLEDAGRHEVDAHRDVAALAGQDQRVRLLGDARHRDRRMGPLEGPEVEPERDVLLRLGNAEPPARRLVDPGLRIVPEIEDEVQHRARDRPMLAGLRVELEELEITWKSSRADAPEEPALGHLVQLGDALRQHEGVVIREARHAGPELHPMRHPQCLRDEEVGARDVLPLRRDVLADPGLLVAELVEEHELLEVVGHRAAGIRARRVERHREVADAHRGLPSARGRGRGRAPRATRLAYHGRSGRRLGGPDATRTDRYRAPRGAKTHDPGWRPDDKV